MLGHGHGMVAVGLYGPMPSSKHFVVVQDLTTRFPTAKVVTSTKADKVLPASNESMKRMDIQRFKYQIRVLHLIVFR